MNRFILLLPLYCFTALAAQENELAFARYLYGKGYYDNASLQLRLMSAHGQSQGADSLYYYSGLCYEKLSISDSAMRFYNAINPSNAFYANSRFRLALLFATEKNYARSRAIMDSLPALSGCYEDLRQYFNAAFSMLEKKGRAKYDFNCNGSFGKSLAGHAGTLAMNERRSPFVGGLLSAIVPGLGRVYAGKPRLALSSFIPIATLGFQAWEGYHHKGFNSARFWIFGSVATIFYIGNIYGSALSVKIAKQERYDVVENQLMLDLRLSFRDLYGKEW